MTDQPSHPRTRLDELIHAPVRLSIIAALASVDRMEFPYLRDLVEISDSLLSKHLSVLGTPATSRSPRGTSASAHGPGSA